MSQRKPLIWPSAQLHDPAGPSISLAPHPTGAVPVLSFRDHRDFVLAVRCLANRCEEVPVQPTVHAQAISGLIHWGLIREVDRRTRCQILLLHRAPYSSLPADTIPEQPSADQWIALSQTWRLEHELTHIAAVGWWVRCGSISMTSWPRMPSG